MCLVEWADRVAGCLPAQHLRITLAIPGEGARRALIEARGPRYESVLAALAPHVTG